MNIAGSILEHDEFNASDFANRWQRARISAIEKCVSPASAARAREIAASDNHALERELLIEMNSEAREAVLRAVFDNSRMLGLGVVRHLGLSWELSDLAQILPHMGSPCVSGEWKVHNEARVLRRQACAELATLGHFFCDYWREALDGLVVGVGEDERLARHRSRGHGDSECVDVLFVERFTPPRVVSVASTESNPRSNKFGAVSPEVDLALAPARERFRQMKVKLVLEGESEGVLYYRLDADEGVLCGAGGKLLHDSFLREVTRLFPQVKARDSSPLAVYGGST